MRPPPASTCLTRASNPSSPAPSADVDRRPYSSTNRLPSPNKRTASMVAGVSRQEAAGLAGSMRLSRRRQLRWTNTAFMISARRSDAARETPVA